MINLGEISSATFSAIYMAMCCWLVLGPVVIMVFGGAADPYIKGPEIILRLIVGTVVYILGAIFFFTLKCTEIVDEV